MKYILYGCLLSISLHATLPKKTVETAAQLALVVYDEEPVHAFKQVFKHDNPIYGNRLRAFYDATNDKLYIAIRGTEKIQTWIANAHVATHRPWENFIPERFQIYYQQLKKLPKGWFILAYEDLKQAVYTVLKDYPDTKIVLTGHSYGGLMANLLIHQLYQFNPRTQLECHTFDAPGAKETRVNTLKLAELPAKILRKVVNHVRVTDVVGNFNTHDGEVVRYPAAARFSNIFDEHTMRHFAQDLEAGVRPLEL